MQDTANGGRTGVDRYIAEGGYPQGTYPQGDYEGGYGLNLGELQAMAWRQRRLVGVLTGIALITGLIITLLVQPIYQASATVRIDNESINVTGTDDANPTVSLFETDRYMKTLQDVVLSRRMALQVVDRLNLAQNRAMVEKMGIMPSEQVAEMPAASLREILVSHLQGNVSMDIPQQSRVTSIGFTSTDNETAALIANEYAETFVEYNVRGQDSNNAQAREVLQTQIEETRDALSTAEQAAVNYARANQLIYTQGAGGGEDGDGASATQSSIVASNLTQLNESYATARANRILAEQRWQAAQNTNPLNLAEAQNNSALQALITERTVAQAQLDQARERYLEEHPQVQQARARVNTLGKQIDETAGQIRSSLRNAFEVAQRQEAQLRSTRGELANETLDEQTRRVQFTLLNRDAETLRDQLSMLQARLAQLSSVSDVQANNIQLLDQARVPSVPVSPNLPRNLLISLVLGLVVGAGLAILREALNDKVYAPDDIDRKLGLPLLGTTPMMEDASPQELDDPKSELSEAYYSARAAIDIATGGNVHKSIQITSSQPAEGKSLTSLALARDFASVGRRVLIVDVDLRKPNMHKLMGIKNERGLMDVLASEATMAESIRRGGEGLPDFLPLGAIPSNPAQILGSGLIQETLEKVGKDYDVVMLDSAPVLGLADAPLLARFADHTVLVVEAGRIMTRQAKSVKKRLEENGANLIGVVLSKYDHREAGYSYDYHYSYYAYGDDARTAG